LRQLAIALHHYHLDYGRFPPAMTSHPRHAWGTFLLPYLEERALHMQIDLNVDWDHPNNRPVIGRPVKLFLCPSAPTERPELASGLIVAHSDYSAIFDVDARLVATGLVDPWHQANQGVLMLNDSLALTDILDGTSTTLLLVEDAGRPQHWRRRQPVGRTEAAGWATFNAITPINLDGFSPDGVTMWGPCAVNCTNVHEIYAFHTSGANVVFADGHVGFLRDNVNIRVVASFVTSRGGEPVSAADLD
jgi:prepilin-type processing-associated H-X9-DG protein